MFTLCIPTIDRFDDFLSKYLPHYISNELIDEIVITDENGNDVNKIKDAFPNNEKLVLIKNDVKLGPFLNKIKACREAKNEWIVLIDSDNFASKEYFNVAKEYIENFVRETKNIILAPEKALPNFDYSHLAGFIYKKGNFKNNSLLEKNVIKKHNCESIVMMNTGNYVINKWLIQNLDLSKETNIHESPACDVIYFNVLLFEQLDLHLHVVPKLEYQHVVHDGSVYIQTCNQFRHFSDYIHGRYYSLE
jgi:hypothetical protein